ncbi:MAG: hypothetical protein NZM06_09215 [Chloroherpetonaceae bacterium]|nr:hypothetical protein [Chloroherpetonaceae bacterium]MDW8437325.1 hypothetical protein [Chloroherpetonaceae bacterium]
MLEELVDVGHCATIARRRVVADAGFRLRLTLKNGGLQRMTISETIAKKRVDGRARRHSALRKPSFATGKRRKDVAARRATARRNRGALAF